jgi:hypothetical protein
MKTEPILQIDHATHDADAEERAAAGAQRHRVRSRRTPERLPVFVSLQMD